MKIKKIYYKVKSYFPIIKKAKQWKEKNYIEVWHHGNCHSWTKPKIVQFGFSGSNADPYFSFHVYIWKIDIWFWHNPFKWFMNKWQDFKRDLWQKQNGERCPKCGSWKLRESHGFAGEPLVYCKKCGYMIWSADPDPYCR